jgi:hypothetical protein
MSDEARNRRMRKGKARERVERVKRTANKSGAHPRFIAERWLRYSEAARSWAPTEVFVATMISMGLGWPCEDGAWTWAGADELAERTRLDVTTVKKTFQKLCGKNGPFEKGSRKNKTGELVVGGHVGEGYSLAFRLKESILRDPRWQDGYAEERGAAPPSEDRTEAPGGCVTAPEGSVTAPRGWHYESQSVASEEDSKASIKGICSLVDPRVDPASRPTSRPIEEGEPFARVGRSPGSTLPSASGFLPAATEERSQPGAVAPTPVTRVEECPLLTEAQAEKICAAMAEDGRMHGVPSSSAVINMVRKATLDGTISRDHVHLVPDVLKDSLESMGDFAVPRTFDVFLSLWLERLADYDDGIARLFDGDPLRLERVRSTAARAMAANEAWP